MSASDNQVLFRRAPAAIRRRGVKAFAKILRDQVASGRPFECLITDDRELHALNARFLGKQYPTDVLSFPADPQAEGGLLGSMAISAQRAREQARQFGHSLQEEIQILMLHGVLHLLGMDHETDRGRMARAEADWRTRLGLPAGLIERVKA